MQKVQNQCNQPLHSSPDKQHTQPIRFQTPNCFRTKLRLRCLNGFWIDLCIIFWRISTSRGLYIIFSFQVLISFVYSVVIINPNIAKNLISILSNKLGSARAWRGGGKGGLLNSSRKLANWDAERESSQIAIQNMDNLKITHKSRKSLLFFAN